MSGDPRHDIVEVRRADGTVAWSGPRYQLDAALAESQPSDPMAERKAKQAAKLARANAIVEHRDAFYVRNPKAGQGAWESIRQDKVRQDQRGRARARIDADGEGR